MKQVDRCYNFGPMPATETTPSQYVCGAETAAHPERLREKFRRLMEPVEVREATARDWWNVTRIGVAHD